MVDIDEVWEGGDVVCIDFDGTLTQGKAKYWKDEIEEPNHQMITWVQRTYYEGNTIVIHTARPWAQARNIAARLTEWGVPYHGLRCEKGGSAIYIDDKSVRPEEVLNDSTT